MAIGVLAAMISPATPSGWRTIIAWRLGTALVVVLAVEAAALAGHEVAHLDRGAGLAERVLRRLAGLGGDDRGDLVGVALEQLGDPAQDARRARRACSRAQAGCAARGGGDRRRRRRAASERATSREQLAGRGRELLEASRRDAAGRSSPAITLRDRPRSPPASCSCREASVDSQLVPGDVARRVGGEEDQRPAEVVGSAMRPSGTRAQYLRQELRVLAAARRRRARARSRARRAGPRGGRSSASGCSTPAFEAP